MIREGARGGAEGGPSGRGAGPLVPPVNLGRVRPVATFNPETNFTRDAAAAGRCRGADPVPGTQGPGVVARGEESGAKLPHQEAVVGLCSWALPEHPQPTLGLCTPGSPFPGRSTTPFQINFIDDVLSAL